MKSMRIAKCVASVALCLSAGVAAAGEDKPGLCCLDPIGNAPARHAVARGAAEELVLTFEGLENLEQVLDFYAGGAGGDGSGPGPDFSVTFSDNAQAIISQAAGGTGNFLLNPSGDTILFFLSGDAATMTLGDGFENGFSFYYSAAFQPGVIRVYDGPDGSGNVLAELDLPVTPSSGETGFDFDNWQPVGVEFDGVALSVDFGGTIDQIGFDNITPGSDVPGGAEPPPPGPQPSIPVPLGSPFVWLMLCTVLLVMGMGLVRGRGNG